MRKENIIQSKMRRPASNDFLKNVTRFFQIRCI